MKPSLTLPAHSDPSALSPLVVCHHRCLPGDCSRDGLTFQLGYKLESQALASVSAKCLSIRAGQGRSRRKLHFEVLMPRPYFPDILMLLLGGEGGRQGGSTTVPLDQKCQRISRQYQQNIEPSIAQVTPP